MVSKDYTQEMGLKPTTPMVPLPLAIIILALGGAALWYGVTKLYRTSPGHRASHEAPAAPAATPAKP
jgi:hypothetical protein